MPPDQVTPVATRSQLPRPRVPPNLGALERLAVERAGLVEVAHVDADLHRRHSGARYPGESATARCVRRQLRVPTKMALRERLPRSGHLHHGSALVTTHRWPSG